MILRQCQLARDDSSDFDITLEVKEQETIAEPSDRSAFCYGGHFL